MNSKMVDLLSIFKKKKLKKKLPNYNHRILFVQDGCVHCKLIYGVVEEFNIFLKPEKRIRIVDMTDKWNYDIDLEPIANHIDIKGTPTLYMGGENPVLVEGVTTRDWLKGFLKGYLEKVGDL